VRILSDTGFSKNGDVGVQVGTENNKFAVLAINSNVTSPDLLASDPESKGKTGDDFVTGQQISRFIGAGRVQGLNSKIVMSISKTNFSAVVDTDTIEETIKGDTYQLPL
jgi:hypothetical protein